MNSLSSLLPAQAEAPDHFQFLPPGLFTCVGQVEGSPRAVSVVVDAALCGKLNEQLRFWRQGCALRGGHLPRITFNHDDRQMAGEIMELFWAGDDAKLGGIRARVRWTNAGRSAVESREYHRFSPQLILDESGKLIGVGSYLGSLTNRPSFPTIAPILDVTLPEGEAEITLNPMLQAHREIFRIAIS